MSEPTGKFVSIDDADRATTTERNDGGIKSDSGTSFSGGNDAPEELRIDAEFIEPGSIPIDAPSGNPRRTKRGTIDRRTKAGRTNEKVSSAVGIDGLSIKDILIGIHAFGASMTGIEELEIDESEAKKLGDATEELSKIYGKTIDPKTAAWVNFAAAAGVVYGPRIIAYRARMAAERAAKPKTGPQPVPRQNAAPQPEKPRKADQLATPSEMWPEPLAGF